MAIEALALPAPAAVPGGRTAPRAPAAARIAIRRMGAGDEAALREFFLGLTPPTLRERFHLGLRQVPESLLRQMTAAREGQVVMLARCGGRVVAEARYALSRDARGAELALVVAEDWRRLGLGSALVRALMRHARAAGIRRLLAEVLPENNGVLAFLRSLGAAVGGWQDGSLHVRLEL